METYTALRLFADSWGLLGLTLVFLGMIVFLFRPGARAIHRDAASVPFRNDRIAPDDKPQPEEVRR